MVETLVAVTIGVALILLIERRNKKREKSERLEVRERSNVIQYDHMGYPLRLCIMSDGTQMWIDTKQREGDVVLKWKTEEEE